MWSALPRERKWHIAVTIVAGAIALLAGIAVGSASGGGDKERPAADPGPRHSEHGVGVGFERSRAGAAQAVATYQRAFATPAILRAGVLRERIGVVSTPDYAATMLAANTPGARRIGSGPIGIGAREGLPTLYTNVPIGYRVESYSGQRARVLTWGFTLLGNASTVEPEAYFGLARTELAWQGGDWRIASVRSGFGPTPRIETGGTRLGGYRLMALARGLKSYGSVP